MRFLSLMASIFGFSFLGCQLAVRSVSLPYVLPATTLGLVVGSILGITVPLLYLMQLRSARLKAFAAQLPDTLDVIVSSLQAGPSLGLTR